MRMHFVRHLVALCVVVGSLMVALSAPVRAEDAASAQPADIESILPADVVLHVVTGPLKGTMADAEKFAMKVIEGAPVPLPIGPGALAAMLPRLSMMPPGAIDQEKRLELVVTNEGRMGMILPVADFAAQVKELQAGEMAETTEDGLLSVNPPQGGRTFLTDLGGGLVLSAPSAADAKHLSDVLKNWLPERKEVKGSATLVVTADLRKLLLLNRGALDAMVEDWVAKLAEAPLPEGETAEIAQGLLDLVPLMITDLRTVIEQSKSLRCYVYAKEESLSISGYASPMPQSNVSKFVQGFHESPAKYEMVRYLPQESHVAYGANKSKASFALLEEPTVRWVSHIVKVVNPGEVDAMVDVIRKSMALVEGEMAVGVLNMEGQNYPTQISYMQTADAAKGQKVLEDTFATMVKLLESGLELFELPVKVKLNHEAGAGTVEGVSYSKFSVALAEDEVEGQNVPAQMRTVLGEMVSNMTTVYGFVDNVLVTVNGPETTTAFGQAVVSLREKKVQLGGDKLFKQSLEQTKSKQAMFMSMRLLDVVKSQLLQSSQTNPMLGPQLKAIAEGIPAATVPVTIALGTYKSEGEGAEGDIYSLKFMVNLPSQALNETVRAGMDIQMQMMMGGGMPPQEDPDGHGRQDEPPTF